MPRLLDKRTLGDLTRLSIFIVLTTLATSMLVITIGNLSFGPTDDYSADFVDATGVVKGDDVRIAGVKVGNVKKVEVVGPDRARVTFKVDSSTRIDDATHVKIRYRNLLGQRYLTLDRNGQDGKRLDGGSVIPVSRTEGALDLSVLFNGFKPLFEALSPDDINKLSFEIVQVFQGEGGTMENLLSSTASVTQTLADRDQVIGDLITNLDYVLDHVADRDKQLSQLITSFRQLVGGLNDDREAILGSLDSISDLSVQTAALVKGIRKPFVRDIRELRVVATNLSRGRKEIDRTLQVLPIKLTKIGRTATYGSWFNFYICHFKAQVHVPGLATPLGATYAVTADRCTLR